MTIGDRFNRLVVLEVGIVRGATRPYKHARVLCDCGAERMVRETCLRTGATKSCGCLARDLTAVRAVRHGRRNSHEYWAWQSIIQRCENPKHEFFLHYGGRGIRICAEWRQSFEAFFRDVGPRPASGYSVDRKDNDGHYEPGNVRWASRVGQARNRRTTLLSEEKVRDIRRLYANGESLASLARRFGVGAPAIHAVVNHVTWRATQEELPLAR